MGTGKSTLAQALAREGGWALFSSDLMRKQLAQLDPTRPQEQGFGQGIYAPNWTTRTYHALRDAADSQLSAGRSVLLDASFLRRADRQMMAEVACAHGAAAYFVECLCPREQTLGRLAERWHRRAQTDQALSHEAVRASDGRPDLYDAQGRIWEAFVSEEEPGVKHICVGTDQPLACSREHVLGALGIPRRVCWLA